MGSVFAAVPTGPSTLEVTQFGAPLVDRFGAPLVPPSCIVLGEPSEPSRLQDALRFALEQELPISVPDQGSFAELQRVLRESTDDAMGALLREHVACREGVRREEAHQRDHDGWVSYMTGLPAGLYGFRLLCPVRNERAPSTRDDVELGSSAFDPLFEPNLRAERIGRINAVFQRFYAAIAPGTSLDEATAHLLADRSAKETLETACGLRFDDALLRAVALQAQEMLSADGVPKMRSAGMYYATHPMMVAALANELAKSAGFSDDDRRDAVLMAVLHDIWEEGEGIRRPEDLSVALGIPASLAISPFLLDAPYSLTAMPTTLFEGPSRGSWWFNGFKVWAAFHELMARCPPTLQVVELADRLDSLVDPFLPPEEPERRISFVAWMWAKSEGMIDAITASRPELRIALALKVRILERTKSEDLPRLRSSGTSAGAEQRWRFFRARVVGACNLFRRVREVHLAEIGDYYRPYLRYLDGVRWEAPE